ncbi:MAG: branched-chain amino acid ABC transporter permease [Deltaproteobacteria bacterium]|nr:branched-chain amino acid ABC transporter permease [Deltaproteobacteria bacterium]
MRKLQFHPCGSFKISYQEELTIFSTDFGRLWMIIGIILLFGVVPFVSNAYMLYILNSIGIYAIAAVGLNLLIGFTGQISLGHGAFFGVGAYAGAILATKGGVPFFLAAPIAGIVSAAVGMVFGLPSARLKHLYLCIATLAGQFIIEYVLVQWEGLTGGAMGIVVPSASLFGLDLGSDRAFFYVIFICFVLMAWIAVNLIRTRIGRAFIAIRDNDRAAEGMGIPIFPYKLLSFAISSFYAGFAGALFAYYTMSITPEPFNLWLSIEFIAMIIIGGLGSIPGSVFGTIFIVALNEVLSHITEYLMNVGTSTGVAITIAPLREFVYGLAIVLFIIFEPKGLAEVWRIVRSNFRLWPFSY